MIDVKNLGLTAGNFALKDVSLNIEKGEYFVLLGPTGSGKTLLTESLCGLNRIDSGTIHINGTNVTHLEPRERGIGYVPQDYALFPNKTVRQNVQFGLKYNRTAKDENEVMELLGISHLADRFPKRLSGGEKQRIALARALAIEPNVLVLDEPVSALDEKTRDEICRELKQLQRTSGVTTIHVCHNFAEMLAVADRVGVIDNGRILQIGTPQDVLQRPNSTHIAQFVQAGNLLPATATPKDDRLELDCGSNIKFHIPPPVSEVGQDVTVMIRCENIQIVAKRPTNVPPETTIVEGTIKLIVDLGAIVKIHVTCGRDMTLAVTLGKKEYRILQLAEQDLTYLAIASEDIHVLQQDGRAAGQWVLPHQH